MTIKTEITASPKLSAIAAIHDACFARSWNAEAIAEMLAIKGTMAVVAASDGEAAGFALLRHLVDEAEILTLAVLPGHRRGGVGDALVRAMRDWSYDNGVQSILLEVNEHNEPARKMYEKNGFSIISRRKEYYCNSDGSHEHALVMRAVVE